MSLFRPLPGAVLRDRQSGRVAHLDRGAQWNVFVEPLRTGEAWEGARRLHVQWDGSKFLQREYENDVSLGGVSILRDAEQARVGGTTLAFHAGGAAPRDEPRSLSAIDDMLVALGERDVLVAAPALAQYSSELLAGKRDVETGLAVVQRLVELNESERIAPLVETARSVAFDVRELGLRLTAVKVLGVLVSLPDARRTLEALRIDQDARVRGAAAAALR